MNDDNNDASLPTNNNRPFTFINDMRGSISDRNLNIGGEEMRNTEYSRNTNHMQNHMFMTQATSASHQVVKDDKLKFIF